MHCLLIAWFSTTVGQPCYAQSNIRSLPKPNRLSDLPKTPVSDAQPKRPNPKPQDVKSLTAPPTRPPAISFAHKPTDLPPLPKNTTHVDKTAAPPAPGNPANRAAVTLESRPLLKSKSTEIGILPTSDSQVVFGQPFIHFATRPQAQSETRNRYHADVQRPQQAHERSVMPLPPLPTEQRKPRSSAVILANGATTGYQSQAEGPSEGLTLESLEPTNADLDNPEHNGRFEDLSNSFQLPKPNSQQVEFQLPNLRNATADIPSSVAIANTVDDTFNAPSNVPRPPSESQLTSDVLEWTSKVAQPILQKQQSIFATPSQLFELAIQHSYHLSDLQYEPWIQGTSIAAANAAFDPVLFTDTFFDGRNEPVGNELTTGGAERLEEDEWRFNGGIRKNTRRGGSLDLTQQLGHNTSNSDFFVPNSQGNSRVVARLSQPLLRNRQIDTNRSLVLTAQFETETARANFHQLLQERLREIANTYWQLYQERASNVLRKENLEKIRSIARILEDRKSFDVSQSQVLLAQSSVRTLEAELANSENTIENIEAQLATLTNAPELELGGSWELIPTQSPALLPLEFNELEQVTYALTMRPEVRSINYQIQTARTQYQLACEQTKPKLDLVVEGYLAELRGGSDIPGAWAGQFTSGKPGYSGGLEFEVPYRNRQANATVRRRKLQLEQLSSRLLNLKASISRDVSNSIRSIDAARDQSQSRVLALQAAQRDLRNLQDRWTLAGGAVQARTQLEQVLGAHSRVLNQRLSLLNSLVEYHQRLVDLQFASGVLIQFSENAPSPLQMSQ